MRDLQPKRSELDPIEIASRDEIAALQLGRLKQTLRHAYDNVESFRAKCETVEIAPEDCRALGDLAKFPFTTKADLRDAYPFGMVAVPHEKIARIHASSGTTGKPTVVAYTKGDIDIWSDVMARSIRAAGGRPGMKVHVAYGYGLFTGGLGAHYGAERLGCAVIPVSGGMTERQVQLIHDFRPEIVMVTPSYMLAILDEFRTTGVDPRDSSLEVGIFGAEPWTNAMRAEIEQSFDMHAVDIYGLSEVIGPGVSCECVETKDGPHIWEDHFYPEVIDPSTRGLLHKRFDRNGSYSAHGTVLGPVLAEALRHQCRGALGGIRLHQSQQLPQFAVDRHPDIGVVLQELARGFPALADALALVAEPGAALFHHVLRHPQVEQVASFETPSP